jgi:hypothetical protein
LIQKMQPNGGRNVDSPGVHRGGRNEFDLARPLGRQRDPTEIDGHALAIHRLRASENASLVVTPVTLAWLLVGGVVGRFGMGMAGTRGLNLRQRGALRHVRVVAATPEHDVSEETR